MLVEKSEEIVLRDEDRDITVYRIRFASGFNVWGLPSEARSLRSKQGRVILDEVAFVDDLPRLGGPALHHGTAEKHAAPHRGRDVKTTCSVFHHSGKRSMVNHNVLERS